MGKGLDGERLEAIWSICKFIDHEIRRISHIAATNPDLQSGDYPQIAAQIRGLKQVGRHALTLFGDWTPDWAREYQDKFRE